MIGNVGRRLLPRCAVKPAKPAFSAARSAYSSSLDCTQSTDIPESSKNERYLSSHLTRDDASTASSSSNFATTRQPPTKQTQEKYVGSQSYRKCAKSADAQAGLEPGVQTARRNGPPQCLPKSDFYRFESSASFRSSPRVYGDVSLVSPTEYYRGVKFQAGGAAPSNEAKTYEVLPALAKAPEQGKRSTRDSDFSFGGHDKRESVLDSGSSSKATLLSSDRLDVERSPTLTEGKRDISAEHDRNVTTTTNPLMTCRYVSGDRRRSQSQPSRGRGTSVAASPPARSAAVAHSGSLAATSPSPPDGHFMTRTRSDWQSASETKSVHQSPSTQVSDPFPRRATPRFPYTRLGTNSSFDGRTEGSGLTPGYTSAEGSSGVSGVPREPPKFMECSVRKESFNAESVAGDAPSIPAMPVTSASSTLTSAGVASPARSESQKRVCGSPGFRRQPLRIVTIDPATSKLRVDPAAISFLKQIPQHLAVVGTLGFSGYSDHVNEMLGLTRMACPLQDVPKLWGDTLSTEASLKASMFPRTFGAFNDPSAWPGLSVWGQPVNLEAPGGTYAVVIHCDALCESSSPAVTAAQLYILCRLSSVMLLCMNRPGEIADLIHRLRPVLPHLLRASSSSDVRGGDAREDEPLLWLICHREEPTSKLTDLEIEMVELLAHSNLDCNSRSTLIDLAALMRRSYNSDMQRAGASLGLLVDSLCLRLKESTFRSSQIPPKSTHHYKPMFRQTLQAFFRAVAASPKRNLYGEALNGQALADLVCSTVQRYNAALQRCAPTRRSHADSDLVPPSLSEDTGCTSKKVGEEWSRGSDRESEKQIGISPSTCSTALPGTDATTYYSASTTIATSGVCGVDDTGGVSWKSYQSRRSPSPASLTVSKSSRPDPTSVDTQRLVRSAMNQWEALVLRGAQTFQTLLKEKEYGGGDETYEDLTAAGALESLATNLERQQRSPAVSSGVDSSEALSVAAVQQLIATLRLVAPRLRHWEKRVAIGSRQREAEWRATNEASVSELQRRLDTVCADIKRLHDAVAGCLGPQPSLILSPGSGDSTLLASHRSRLPSRDTSSCSSPFSRTREDRILHSAPRPNQTSEQSLPSDRPLAPCKTFSLATDSDSNVTTLDHVNLSPVPRRSSRVRTEAATQTPPPRSAELLPLPKKENFVKRCLCLPTRRRPVNRMDSIMREFAGINNKLDSLLAATPPPDPRMMEGPHPAFFR